MVRLLVNLALAMLLFAGGLGVSWYMLQRGLTSTATKETPVGQPLTSKLPADLQADQLAGEEAAELPVPVRAQPMTAEEIFRYGASIRGQYEALAKRREEIEREENRLELIYEDIRGTRNELDGIQARVNDALTMAERLLAQLQAEWIELEAQMPTAGEAAEKTVESPTAYVPGELENTKKLSNWLQDMPTESAAEYLKQLSNDGKIATAAKLLDNIESRDAAKILSAMEDPSLWIQLSEALSRLERPEQTSLQR